MGTMVNFEIVPNMVTFHKNETSYNNALKLNGTTYRNNHDLEFIIVEYINAKNIIVRFTVSGYTTRAEYHDIIKGSVKDPFNPIIYNVGYMGHGTYPINKKSEPLSIKCYTVWTQLLSRCYNDSGYNRNASYFNIVTVSEEWKCYQNFAKWYFPRYYELPNNEMVCIDKDLLSRYYNVPANYGADTCCLLPRTINSALMMGKGGRNDLMIGVSRNPVENASKPFIASISMGERSKKNLGLFYTEYEAFLVYKEAREKRIKEIADKYKEYLEPIVYNALCSYCIREDD